MRTLIVADNDGAGRRVHEYLGREWGDWLPCGIVRPEQVVDTLRSAQVELVVIVLSEDFERTYVVLEDVRVLSQAHVVVVGPGGNTKLVLRAMHEGANDFVSFEEFDKDFDEALNRIQSKSLTLKQPGKTITLLAPNGGSGSSTLAVNIATLLAKEHQRCALLDMKLTTGDLAALLDLKPTHHLAELCLGSGRIDRPMFERSLTVHGSGVHLLASPPTFRDATLVTAAGIRQALNLSRSMFPYVVVDVDHAFREEQELILQQSDLVLVVFRLDFISLRNARKTLDFLEHLGMGTERIRLVANRHGQPKEVPVAMAEEALGVKIGYLVPDEPKTINRANNNGVPVVLDRPSAWVSKSMMQLTSSINGRPHS